MYMSVHMYSSFLTFGTLCKAEWSECSDYVKISLLRSCISCANTPITIYPNGPKLADLNKYWFELRRIST